MYPLTCSYLEMWEINLFSECKNRAGGGGEEGRWGSRLKIERSGSQAYVL